MWKRIGDKATAILTRAMAFLAFPVSAHTVPEMALEMVR
jgi:hypothetical protein